MPEPTSVRVTDPGAVLSVVPLLLGYEPGDGDTVILGLDGDRGRVVVAIRLDAEAAREISAEHMGTVLDNAQRAGVESALIVGYGKAVTPAVDHVCDLVGRELPIRDALRVEDNRFWSYCCDDLECCPAEGREFQAETAASTTLRAEGGLTAAPSRDDIAASIAGPTGEQAEAAEQAWDRAVREPRDYAADRALITQALADCHEDKLPGREQAASLAAALTRLPVRDQAWARCDREHADQHTELWKSVVRNIPEHAAAAPSSLLAFTAWQTGNGALANLAVDRALEADPGYSMARLIGHAITAGIPATQAEPPMTPAEVEQSYIDQGRIEPEIRDYEMDDLEAS